MTGEEDLLIKEAFEAQTAIKDTNSVSAATEGPRSLKTEAVKIGSGFAQTSLSLPSCSVNTAYACLSVCVGGVICGVEILVSP